MQTFTTMRARTAAPNVIVVLPAYNERESVEALVSSLDAALVHSRFPHSIIVVNDGSTDDTLEILERCRRSMRRLSIVDHEKNAGLGATIRDGLLCAVQEATEDDIIITMDADLTHVPALMLRMIALIREGFDVVIASRYQPGSRVIGLSLGRTVLSAGASTLLRLLFPIVGVRDYTCGYRAYRARVLKEAITEYGPAFVDQDGFQCMVDILLKLRRRKHVFGEVPMVLRYDLKRGKSKMSVWHTVIATLKLVVIRRWGA